MSCFDMLMTVAPCNLVTIGVLGLALVACLSSLSQPAFITYRVIRMLGRIILTTLRGVSFSLFVFGACTMSPSGSRSRARRGKKILYVFTFPLFMLTYIPISLAALVGKVEWKPIRHGLTKAEKGKEQA